MSPSATRATQSAASRVTKTIPSAPPSAISATPATQNEGGCEIAPCLPRKTKVDVRLRHACHAKRRWMWNCATPATQSAVASRATKTSQCHKCHACHAKPRWMWDGATPATQNEGGCEIVPRLPRKVPRRHGPVPWVPRLPRKMVCAR